MYEADRRIKLQRARGLRLANDKTAGRLIDALGAQRATFEAFRIVRENVLNVPARLGAQLAALTDPVACIQLLEAELRQALASASDRLEAAG